MIFSGLGLVYVLLGQSIDGFPWNPGPPPFYPDQVIGYALGLFGYGAGVLFIYARSHKSGIVPERRQE